METFRKIINGIFWIIFIGGVIFLAIMLAGGAFPIDMGGSHTVKFDIARIGWEINDPANGAFTIVREQPHVKVGWGALQYDYKYVEGKRPGFHSTSYPVDGFLNISFWMKAKHPCMWQMQLKRRSDSKIFTHTYNVGTEWKKYTVNVYGIIKEVNHQGKYDRHDYQAWINFIDMSPTPTKRPNNTVWIDHIFIER